MNTEFSVIENKIGQFIRKYYLDQLIKGLIAVTVLFIIFTLIILFTEYFLYLSVVKKYVVLITYLLSLSASVVYFIVIPLFGFIGIRKKLTQEKVNTMIVKHFPEIKDQLWNVLELNQQHNFDRYSIELVLASIDQKIESLKRFKFVDAINIKENLRFLLILFGFILVGSSVVIFLPNIVKNSSERLIHYDQTYTKPSPFLFQVLNEKLAVGKGDNFRLLLQVDSEESYDNVFINFGGNTYIMKSDSMNYYSYTFSTLNNSIDFTFNIDKYYSEQFHLKVLAKPILSSFSVQVNKPRYTYLKSDTYENITELVIPTGSVCNFKFNTYQTDSMIIQFDKNNIVLDKNFVFARTFKEDKELLISLKNLNFYLPDILKIIIKTIQDEYPSIQVDQVIDSVDYTRVYFRGVVVDDYGFKKLNFITKINDQIDTTFSLDILPNLLQQDFFYAYNFNAYKSKTKSVNYYFEIFDNDDVNGSKSSVSEQFSFSFPDSKDVFDYQDNQFDNIENVLSNSMNLTKELKDDLENLQEKMINSDLSDYERKETIKNIFSKKQELEEAIKNIQERNAELNSYLESFTDQNQEILDKQKQLQDILEDVFSDELKKLMEEFNKMLDEFNEDKMNNLTEEMDISLDDLSKQLDKNLELLKRMKIEQQLNMIADDLQKHIEKQQALSDSIEKGEKPADLMDEQNKEKEALEQLKDQYEQIDELNKGLEEPLNLYDFEEEFSKIDDEFQKSLDNQSKNNKKKSQESMQQNKSNMESLAFMMKQMMDAAFEQQEGENLANLIQILNNLVIFSFNQEEIIKAPLNANFDQKIYADQKKLYTDFNVIRDSLYTLAKREPSVNTIVNKEIVTIQNNFKRIDSDLAEGRLSQTKINQQIVLTSANNLALFLSEVIKNLQQQMANSMPGNQNCQKPGNNPNPSSMNSSMKSMQKSLQQQLEKMMQMMKEGQSESSMQGEMGKALSQQEKMQNMLQKMMNQGNVGSDAYETLKQAEQLLNKVREDIIKNNISNQTVNRQKEIMTRLLEAENAQNERDLDEKRKSNTAEEQRVSETAKYFDNKVLNDKFEERLIKHRLILKRYYQQKYQNYVNQLDSINGSNN